MKSQGRGQEDGVFFDVRHLEGIIVIMFHGLLAISVQTAEHAVFLANFEIAIAGVVVNAHIGFRLVRKRGVGHGRVGQEVGVPVVIKGLEFALGRSEALGPVHGRQAEAMVQHGVEQGFDDRNARLM